jgi:putative isomerase
MPIAVVAVVLTAAAPSAAQAPPDFPDALSYVGRPQRPDDWPTARFSDLGAWFGYTLPPPLDADLRGSFVGPFLIDRGSWLTTVFSRAVLVDQDTGADLSFGAPADVVSYPGRLHQQLRADEVELSLDLVIVSPTAALIRAVVANRSDRPRRIALHWTGTLDSRTDFFEAAGRSIGALRRTTLPAVQLVAQLEPAGPASWQIELTGDRRGYRASVPAVELTPGGSFTTYIAHRLFGAVAQDPASLDAVLADPPRALEENNRRWSAYLASTLRLAPAFAEDQGCRLAAVKALMTLIGNWRAPNRGLRHAGLFPSTGVRYFNGFWAWDSWKHAVALARIAPDLAKDQIRAMFDYQDADGMVPDCVYADARENNWLNTKPPLAAWAVWKVHEATADAAFLAELYPKLLNYHRWWYARRDRDRSGICEYGATADRLDAAKWESGMDNAVRFDGATLVRSGHRAWSLDQESVDLNAYLWAEQGYLAAIAGALGKPAPYSAEESSRLRDLIRDRMFDAASGYFYDVRTAGIEPAFVKAQGPEGWIPLWAGVATPAQAEAVRRVVVDPEKFATFVPFPTLAADDPRLDRKGYWRGPVWIDQAWFAVAGLRRYGYAEDALRLTRQLLDHLEGLKEKGVAIRENYDPLNGKGLEAADFSWSAAHLLLMLWGQ